MKAGTMEKKRTMDAAKFNERVEMITLRLMQSLDICRNSFRAEVVTGEHSGEWVAYFRPVNGVAAFVFILDEANGSFEFECEYPGELEFATFDNPNKNFDDAAKAWKFAVGIEAAIRDRVHSAI